MKKNLLKNAYTDSYISSEDTGCFQNTSYDDNLN